MFYWWSTLTLARPSILTSLAFLRATWHKKVASSYQLQQECINERDRATRFLVNNCIKQVCGVFRGFPGYSSPQLPRAMSGGGLLGASSNMAAEHTVKLTCSSPTPVDSKCETSQYETIGGKAAKIVRRPSLMCGISERSFSSQRSPNSTHSDSSENGSVNESIGRWQEDDIQAWLHELGFEQYGVSIIWPYRISSFDRLCSFYFSSRKHEKNPQCSYAWILSTSMWEASQHGRLLRHTTLNTSARHQYII